MEQRVGWCQPNRSAGGARLSGSRLVVWGPGLPTTVEDADPLERQSAYSGLVGTAFIALLSIVSAGPERLVDRLSGPLDKGLSQEGRALPSPMDPMLLTAPLGHRRNTRVLLYC